MSRPSFNILTSLAKTGRYWFLRLLRQPCSPSQTALGLALGVLASCIPLLPVQMLVAVSLAFWLKANKLAAALGTWVTNPVTWVPAHILFYCIGRVLAPFDVPEVSPSRLSAEFIASSWRIYLALLLGGLTVAVPSALITYFVSLKVLIFYQAKRQARQERKARAKLAQASPYNKSPEL